MTESLRIAVWHDLPSGGGRRAMTAHVEGLVERGHTVAVWSTPQEAGPLRLRPELGPFVSQTTVPIPEAGQGLAAFAQLVRSADRVPTVISNLREHLNTVTSQVRAWGAQLLFAGSSASVGCAGAALAMPELPSVLYLQEPARPQYEDWGNPGWRAAPPPTGSLRARLTATVQDLRLGQRIRVLNREEHIGASAFDEILVNSLYSSESVQRAYGLSTRLCYLGVDDRTFKPLDLPREDLVISIGQLGSHKRPHLIVESLGLLPRPPALVWIANEVDSSLAAELHQRANSLNVRLTILHAVPDADLVRLLNRARMHLYAPLLEPFGYAPLEAALCATPTVGVNQAGLRETVIDGETGLLVQDRPESLAVAVQELRDDHVKARQLGLRARERTLEVFDLAQSLDRFEVELMRVWSRKVRP